MIIRKIRHTLLTSIFFILQAHKVVLACSSAYLDQLLKLDITNNSHLDLPISGTAISTLLNYLYSGKLSDTTVETAKELSQIAKEWELHDLYKCCQQFMGDVLMSQNPATEPSKEAMDNSLNGTEKIFVDLRSFKKVFVNEACAEPYQCAICAIRFVVAEACVVHVIKQHLIEHKVACSSVKHYVEKGERKQLFHCDHCSKSFKQRYYLIMHTRTHTNFRPYRCKFCNYTSIQSGTLRTHLKKFHSSEVVSKGMICKGWITESELDQCPPVGDGQNYFDLENKNDETSGASLDYSEQSEPKQTSKEHQEKPFDDHSEMLHPKKQVGRNTIETHRLDNEIAAPEAKKKRMDVGNPSRYYIKEDIENSARNVSAPFQCSKCGKYFEEAKTCTRHIANMHKIGAQFIHTCVIQLVGQSKKKLTCQFCDYRSEDKDEIERHTSISHSGEKNEYNIAKEDLLNYSEEVGAQHIKTEIVDHDPEKQFECSICKKGYNVISECATHVINAHQVLPSFAHYNVVQYVKRHSDMEYKCPLCPMSFSVMHKLKNHTLQHMGHQIMKCQSCGYSTYDKGSMSRHMRAFHNPECDANEMLVDTDMSNSERQKMSSPNAAVGEQISSKFSILQNSQGDPLVPLLQDIPQGQPADMSHSMEGGIFKPKAGQKHSGKGMSLKNIDVTLTYEPYFCSICKVRFKHKQHCMQHVIDVHDMKQDFASSCVTYDKNNKYKLWDQCSEVKCDVPGCEFVCNTRWASMYYHKHFKHDMPLPKELPIYGCQVCGKQCRCLSQLQEHEAQHENKRQRLCSQCGMRFNSENTLRSHIYNVHNLEKKYTCTHCSKTFKQNQQLEIHVRTHVNYRPYKCKLCQYSSCTRGNIRVHLRSKHEITDNYNAAMTYEGPQKEAKKTNSSITGNNTNEFVE